MKTVNKFTVKPGMTFLYNVEKYPYLKDSNVKVISKHGNMFKCLIFDGVMYGEDLFYKFELETMILTK